MRLETIDMQGVGVRRATLDAPHVIRPSSKNALVSRLTSHACNLCGTAV